MTKHIKSIIIGVIAGITVITGAGLASAQMYSSSVGDNWGYHKTGTVLGGYWWYKTNGYAANHVVWGQATAKGTSWYSEANYACPDNSTAQRISGGVWSGPDNRDGGASAYLCIAN